MFQALQDWILPGEKTLDTIVLPGEKTLSFHHKLKRYSVEQFSLHISVRY